MTAGPLEGLRVLDFTANMSGPFATMLLGDQGADVVKVESPEGDAIRSIGTRKGDVSTYFANLNRSKRSVRLDLLQPALAETRLRMLDWADVVVHNLRPSAARRLGIDADNATSKRPALVHAEIIGIGDGQDVAEVPVYDHVLQAMSGIAAQQSTPTAGPQLIRHGVIDKTTGIVLAQAITAAVLQRHQKGTGTRIRVSMLDVAIWMLWPDAMMAHTAIGDVDQKPSIASSFRLTPTRDGQVTFAIATAPQWRALASVVNMDLPAGEDPDRLASWLEHGSAVFQNVRQWLATTDSRSAIEVLWAAGVPSGAVVDLDDLPEQSFVKANQTLEVIGHPQLGPIRQPRPTTRFDGHRPHLPRTARRPVARRAHLRISRRTRLDG